MKNIKIVPYPITCIEFANIKPKIALDNSFNVGSIDKGRWNVKLMASYIESILDGMHVNPIVILDLKSCLNECYEGSDDWDFYKKWFDAGFEYLAVDGNNRSITIHNFFQDKFSLRPGKRVVSIHKQNGSVEDVSFQFNSSNNNYSNLPREVRETLNSTTINLHVVKNATREELTQFFLRLNSGMPLNSQEKRNAQLTQMAKYVRDTADEYKDTLGHQVVKEKQLIRLGWDEAIASCVVFYAHKSRKISINSTTLDNAYEDKSQETRYLPAVTKVLQLALEIPSNNTSMLFKVNKFSKFNFMNWFMFVCHLHDKRFKIVKPDVLLQWFCNSEQRRIRDLSWSIPTSRGSDKLYKELVLDDAKNLSARERKIISDFEKSSLISDGVVIPLDSKRIFTDDQRYEMWERQNRKCPLTNKEIPEYEVLDSNLWHADHINEYSIGGATTIENGQLICAEAHKEKTREFMRKNNEAA